MHPFTICGRDIAAFTIVLPPNAAPALRTAADFLRAVIKTACGVTLPIADSAEHGIFIGTLPTDPEVKWDGYRISTDKSNLYLCGNLPRGTLYAAYSFAERFLGYRYFADDCEIFLDSADTAEIPRDLNILDNPVFEVRRTTCFSHVHSGAFSAHSRLNDCMPVGAEYGGTVGITGDCHTFDSLCPPDLYFKDHPEYYSYRDGRHYPTSGDPNGEHGQLCLTNPDVIRIVTDNVLNQLRNNPAQRVVEISHADNRCYCMCDRCQAVYEEEGAPSSTLIRFLNAIAEEVTKEFPDVLLRTFAYQYTRKPPKKTKAHPNILIRYCTIEACFRHALNDPTCEKNAAAFGPELAEWQKVASNLSIWDYVTNWRCFNAPFPNLISLRENARFFADCHAIHVLAECNAGNGGGVYPVLKAYLLGKLLWNPYMTSEEYDTHINEFLRAYYGKGWASIRAYIDMEHESTAEQEMGCWAEADMASCFSSDTPRIWDHIASHYNPTAYQPVYPGETYLDGLKARMDEVDALFDEAERLAETRAEREHLLISRMSIRYVKLFCMPHEKSKMSESEQAAYEAEVDAFLRHKETYDIRYNVWTSNYLNR